MADDRDRAGEHGPRLTIFGVVCVLVFVAAAMLAFATSGSWPTEKARASACVLGAILVLALQWANGRPGLRSILIGLLMAWSGLSLGWTVARPLAELPAGESVQVWSFFHYYLGVEYFPELGYTDLYEQALAADAEGADRWAYVQRTRDLRTYRVRARGIPMRSEHWTDARWQRFQQDLELMEPYVSKRHWRSIFRDRGYNPPPSFTALRRLFRYLLSPSNLALVGALDLALLALAFGIAARVFGGLRALVCATWVALFFGNIADRLVGQPVLYDYLAALVLAACALEKEKPAWAGALLGYAAMMRVFPGLLVVAGVLWWCLIHWRRPTTDFTEARRLGMAFLATCGVLALLGLANGRGIQGWVDFLSNIRQHSEHHRIGERRVGLGHLFTIDWAEDAPTDQKGRAEIWDAQKGAWLVSSVGVGVLWLWASARARFDLSRMIFGSLVLVFCAVVLSRYYASSACVLLLLGGSSRDGPLGGRGPAAMAALLFAWSAAFYGFAIFEDDRLHRYLLANLVALVSILAALLWTLRRAGRS